MKTLGQQIKEYLINETREERKKEKTSFWCSEAEGNQFDIFHSWKGTPYTNVSSPEEMFGLQMRKILEEVVVGFFDKIGILIKPPEGEEQHRIDIERCGVKVSGKLDALVYPEDPMPVEVKTSFGDIQERELKSGRPKVSYLKQLAQYMDAKNVDKGCLFQVHFKDNFIVSDVYEFYMIRISPTRFKCGAIEFDLYQEVYERYSYIYKNYIEPNIEPKSEFVYKYDVRKIDWKNMPTGKISNARNNRAVIGDWQVIYSGYKNLIIAQEGTCSGYTMEELEYIKEQTKGYTSKDKANETKKEITEALERAGIDSNLLYKVKSAL